MAAPVHGCAPDSLQALRADFAARGGEPAILAISDDAQTIWSFAELEAVSARAASGLIRDGLARGEAVALIAANNPRWIAAFWGIVGASGIAVPLDAQNDDRALGRMIAVGRCRFAFVSAAVAERLRAIAPDCRLIILDRDNDSGADPCWPQFLASPAPELPAAQSDDPAVIVFTSGTTGTPKAVPLSHINLLTNVRALAETKIVGPGDRALLLLPLHHAYPLTIGMITPLALGCAMVLPPGISGPELLATMQQTGVTALVGVPRLYSALLEAVRRGIAARPFPVAALLRSTLAFALWSSRHGVKLPGRILLAPLRRRIAPRLHLLVSGGAAVELEVEQALDALGWEMLTGYGLVETSSMLTFNPPGAARPGSAGRPVPGMAVRIVDPDASGVGEIEAQGPSLFAGYRDDPEKTRDAFTADGWFRTGDLGSVDAEGYLHIAARKTETIVLADGKKIFPEPLETIYATAPLVREIALLGASGALVGLVVPDLATAREAGALRLADSLREGLAAKAADLPSYARLSGFAVTQDALPRTPLGKLRRPLLPALYEAAQRHEASPAENILAPEDQALLAGEKAGAAWRWLQQRFPERSLRLDTILQLDLGIDSLAWVELTLALEREIGVTLREQQIAHIVTVRDLLRAAAAAAEGAHGAALTPADRRWLAPLRLGHRLLRAIGEPLIRFAMTWLFRLQVEGSEKLPQSDPILICPNHVSYLDPFAVGMALPRARLQRCYWGGWTGVAFQTRLRRLFSRAARVVPVDPDRGVWTGLALGRQALEAGWSLVWFPEGTRSTDGRLQRFLPGIGALVENRAVPIVPVYIAGSFDAWPVARRFPRFFARITIRFGDPVIPSAFPSDLTGRRRDEAIAAAVQKAVAALSHDGLASR